MLVNKSKRFMALLSLTLFITFSGNCLQATVSNATMIDFEKTRNEVTQLGEDTVFFLQEINNAIPQLSQDINKIGLLNKDLITTFLKLYGKNIKLSEYFGLYGLKQPEIANKLTLVAIHISIECLLAASIAKLENKAIDAKNTNQKTIELNKEIEYYVTEISKQIDSIRTTLNKTLKVQYNLEIQNDVKTTQKSSVSEKLLEVINLNILPQFLNIQNKERQKSLIEKIQNITAQYLENGNTSKTIETIINKPVIAKIKAATTKESCKELLSTLMVNALPSCAVIKTLSTKIKSIFTIA